MFLASPKIGLRRPHFFAAHIKKAWPKFYKAKLRFAGEKLKLSAKLILIVLFLNYQKIYYYIKKIYETNVGALFIVITLKL